MTDLISRQAAIKAIEDLQDCYNGFSDTYDKACLIGVIEEVPTIEAVSLEDYRSMEQTVYKLTQALAEAEPTKHYNTESYKMTVTDFPPVEYAPIKHGRWIEDEYGFLVCSECGNIAEYLPILGQIETPYCSECGARMDEVKE